MAATRKEIKTWSAADIGADVNQVGLVGSPTQFFEICKFQARRQGEILQGTTEEVVTRAIEKLKRLGML
jgi:electron transfer flavoprotein alpha/beta subunit